MKENKDNKLIYILNHFSNDTSAHFYAILNLLERMAERGINIALIIEKAEDIPQFASPNIEIVPIKSSQIGRILKLACALIKYYRKGYHKIFIRISWLAAIVSIFVSFFTRQISYFWISGQGIHEAYHAMPPGCYKIRFWFGRIFPFNLIRRYISFLLTGPESMADYFIEIRKVDPKKIKVLYNDFDEKRFFAVDSKEKRLLRNKLGLPPKHKIILFLHQMSPERKSSFYLPFILDSFFEKFPNDQVLFLIVGGGEDENKIKAQTRNSAYADKIVYTGPLPQSIVDQYYKSSDIYIQPSYAEGFPRTLIEAMACGLAIVTTRAGGTQDILGKQQLKFMVDINDRQEFGDKLIELYHDQSIQSMLIAENILTSEKFTSDRIAKMYIETLFSSPE